MAADRTISVAPRSGPPISGSMIPLWLKTSLRGRPLNLVRSAVCTIADWHDELRGRRDPLTPPARYRVRVGCFRNFIDAGLYRAVGREFAVHLRSLAHLREDSRMLDIGCGCGQIASALAPSFRGAYHGIDPDAEAISWCNAQLASRLPRFRFDFVDLYNGYYNSRGTVRPETWVMPFAGEAFDVLLLKSIFTHMTFDGVENYLREIRRILADNGRCLCSAYLLNESRSGDVLGLRFPVTAGMVYNPAEPEYIVGWNEAAFRASADRADLSMDVHRGSWCVSDASGPLPLSYQDLIVLRRKGAQ